MAKLNFYILTRTGLEVGVESLEVAIITSCCKIGFQLLYLGLDWMRSTYWSQLFLAVPFLVNPISGAAVFAEYFPGLLAVKLCVQEIKFTFAWTLTELGILG